MRQMHVDTHLFLSRHLLLCVNVLQFMHPYSFVDEMTNDAASTVLPVSPWAPVGWILLGPFWGEGLLGHKRCTCPQLYPDCWIMIQSCCTNSHAHESIFLRLQFSNTNVYLFRCWLLPGDVLCWQACLRVSSGICWFKCWSCDPQWFKRYSPSPTMELFLS